jgi:hypothetical protein
VGWLLPRRIGWGAWLGLWAALALVPWGRHDGRRTWAFAAICAGGAWAGIAFVAQHGPDHNLYWKWMHPLIPVILPLAVAGCLRGVRWLGERAGGATAGVVLVAVLGQGLVSGLVETGRQVALSDDLYRPQKELGQWIEANVPEDVPMILDNIPACWVNRRPHERRLHSWMDMPTPPGDEAAFAAWIRAEGVGWVLWFREDWTEAPRYAPFLSAGGRWVRDGVILTERRREEDYGWIWYEVHAEPQGFHGTLSPG